MRVQVVGAGIVGCSAAAFLELLDPGRVERDARIAGVRERGDAGTDGLVHAESCAVQQVVPRQHRALGRRELDDPVPEVEPLEEYLGDAIADKISRVLRKGMELTVSFDLLNLFNSSTATDRQQDYTDDYVDPIIDGDAFGETAMMSDAPRNATVTAITDSLVYEVTKSQIESLFERGGPDVANTISRVVADRRHGRVHVDFVVNDGVDEDDAAAQLVAFREAGGTLVDTADVYAGGASETVLGRLLADRAAEALSGDLRVPARVPGDQRVHDAGEAAPLVVDRAVRVDLTAR